MSTSDNVHLREEKLNNTTKNKPPSLFQKEREKDDDVAVAVQVDDEQVNNNNNNNNNNTKNKKERNFRRLLLRETEDVLHFYFPTASAMDPLPFLLCANNNDNNHNSRDNNDGNGEAGEAKSTSDLVDEDASLLQLSLLHLRLAVPVALTSGLRGSMLFVTTIIMGHYVSLQTFASIATALSFINITAMNIGNGLCAALDTLATQAHGRRPYDPEIINIFLRSLVCTFAIYAPMAVLYFFAEPFLRLIVHESLIAETAFFLRYSFVIIIPMLLMNNVLKYAQSQRVNYIGLYASSLGFFTLPFILFLLRHQGAVGVLVALGLNRSIMLLYMVFCVARHPRLRQAWTTEEVELPAEDVTVVPAVLDHNNNNNNNNMASSPMYALDDDGEDDDDEDDDFFDSEEVKRKNNKHKKRRQRHKTKQVSFLHVMMAHLRQVLLHSRGELLVFIRISYPVLLASVADSWSFEIFTLIAAHLGTVPAATWNVIMVLYTFLFTVPYGIASAAAVRVGNAVGSGKMLLARRYAIVTVLISLLNGGIFFVVFGVIPSVLGGLLQLLQKEPLVAQTGVSLRYLIGYTLGADGIFYALQGVFRGIGQNKAALGIVVAAMWVVALPLAVLFTLTDVVFKTNPDDEEGSSKIQIKGLLMALSIGVSTGWPLEVLFLMFVAPWKQPEEETATEAIASSSPPAAAAALTREEREGGQEEDEEELVEELPPVKKRTIVK